MILDSWFPDGRMGAIVPKAADGVRDTRPIRSDWQRQNAARRSEVGPKSPHGKDDHANVVCVRNTRIDVAVNVISSN
jgi:hypothetical protein